MARNRRKMACCQGWKTKTTNAISLVRRHRRDRSLKLGSSRGECRPQLANGVRRIDFQTDAVPYRHWKLSVEGPVATLLMDIDERGGLFERYILKLNSYDLGVDTELADAFCIRFEYPHARVAVLRSGKLRVLFADRIVAPKAGIDNKPGDFEYVRAAAWLRRPSGQEPPSVASYERNRSSYGAGYPPCFALRPK
jgi:hypothetical protein